MLNTKSETRVQATMYGYGTSAFVFQGLFKPALPANPNSSPGGISSRTLRYGGRIIWNSSWSAIAKAAIEPWGSGSQTPSGACTGTAKPLHTIRGGTE